jgi:hypothetical protein
MLTYADACVCNAAGAISEEPLCQHACRSFWLWCTEVCVHIDSLSRALSLSIYIIYRTLSLSPQPEAHMCMLLYR